MSTVNVELMTFGKGQIRPVSMPEGVEPTLYNVYRYGQNNILNSYLQMPSVSVGDIIHLGDEKWEVENFGFANVTGERYDVLKAALEIALNTGQRYSDVKPIYW